MTYSFDISYDCPLDEFLKLLDTYNLKLESWITEGPGGGNPEITVSGDKSDINRLDNFWNNQ